MNVAPKPNRPPIWVFCLIGGVVLLGIISSFSSKPTVQVSQSTPAPETPEVVSLDDRIRALAKDEMNNASIGDLSYEGVTVAAYDESDADKLTVSVDYHLTDGPSYDYRMAELAAPLFQKLFALDPRIWHVGITFHGPGKDRYGHESEMIYVAYLTARPTIEKINWQGFDTETLCDFLQKEGEDANSGGTINLDNMCVLARGIKTMEIPSPE